MAKRHHIAKILIENGADIEAVTEQGQTALHICAKRLGGYKCTKLLVEKGADIHKRDNDGKTPFDVAGDKRVKKYLKGILSEKG